MDHPDVSLETFICACLDWLEAQGGPGTGGAAVSVPSLEGLTPREVRRARLWLTQLGEARKFPMRVEGVDGR